eukprot:TRINITY_DN244_c0_g2_i4.p1 TRINITY_DN244_c0_g2~~TRINITY_DN244_c0_g2_i4.p1  ORF type:complete len:148 (+),score=11.57 TRINITY_DN244_c0_g2_i4:95-538(+)
MHSQDIAIGTLPKDSTKPESVNTTPIRQRVDLKEKLLELIKAEQYEKAFTKALEAQDLDQLAWLCSRVDREIFSRPTIPLSQCVLLSIVQQLSCDLVKGTRPKLDWIQDCVLMLDPNDPSISEYYTQTLQQVLDTLSELTPQFAKSG